MSICRCGYLLALVVLFFSFTFCCVLACDGAVYFKPSYGYTGVWSDIVDSAKIAKGGKCDDGAANYAPSFDFSKLGCGFGFGLSFPESRFELEGLYVSRMNVRPGGVSFCKKSGGNKKAKSVMKEYSNYSFGYVALIANAYYDFQINGVVFPYVGFGLGFSVLDFAAYIGDRSFDLALQYKAGVNFSISEFLVPYVGIRIVSFPSISLHFHEVNNVNNNIEAKASYFTYGLELGVMLSFA